MKRALFPDLSSVAASVGLLILRIVFGGAMLQHGLGKLTGPGGPAGWMGPGAPVPGFLQFLATLAELGGGLAIVLGFLTPIAALGWVVTMAVATQFVASKGAPWVSADPKGASFEAALGYLAVAVLLLLGGPGRYSLDHLFLARLKPKGDVRATSSS